MDCRLNSWMYLGSLWNCEDFLIRRNCDQTTDKTQETQGKFHNCNQMHKFNSPIWNRKSRNQVANQALIGNQNRVTLCDELDSNHSCPITNSTHEWIQSPDQIPLQWSDKKWTMIFWINQCFCILVANGDTLNQGPWWQSVTGSIGLSAHCTCIVVRRFR